MKKLVVQRFNLKPLMIVLLAVGVRRLSIPFARHQDREQQPVRPSQHQPQGVQEGPEAGKSTHLKRLVDEENLSEKHCFTKCF